MSIIRSMSDDDLIKLLDAVVATERALNSEVERRAHADPRWPAEIATRASTVYRGYVPILPPKAEAEVERKVVKGVPVIHLSQEDLDDFV